MTRPAVQPVDAAIAAVRRAARVCRLVQDRLISPQTLAKQDKSPVTVADFASQAIVCATLTRMQPPDDNPVVGEEESAELHTEEQAIVREAVVALVTEVMGPQTEPSDVLDWIDLGSAPEAVKAPRFWTVDPIDGTKGFLRREQYAIALALIEQGQVTVGVLGCPNLPIGEHEGLLMVAQRGGGTVALPLDGDGGVEAGQRVQVSAMADAAKARFCESVESGHSDQDASVAIARRLGMNTQPVRMDSQCKYATVSRGEAEIYLRLPTRADYREFIWDHAAGMLCVEEAGGKVTDIDGKPLDFSLGRRLESNRGIIATNGPLHDQTVAAVGQTLSGASGRDPV